MNIIRYYKYQGHIDEISKRYPSFRKVHDFWIKKSFETTWRDKFTGDITYHVLTTFVGKTGYGKSSTINRFFGREIMEISDVKACTRECQSIDFRIRDNTYFSFGDMPGIGEDKARDRHYLKMYEDFLTFSSTIVYILRADMRDYSIDLAAYKRLFRASDLCRRVIFALNYCDKIEPISRVRTDTPTEEQKKNIRHKISELKSIFKPVNEIVPYSASMGWGMNNLASEIVRVTQTNKFVLEKS